MKKFRSQVKAFKKIYFIISLLILIFVFSALFLSNLLLQQFLETKKILNPNFPIVNEAKIPVIKTNFIPLVSAQGALIMDANSKVVLYSKNPNLRFSTASTIKIMTALTALDYFKKEDVLTVKTNLQEGSVIGLTIGEQMTFENLLYAMLLPSANDAALTIAQNYPGGEEAFVEKMNQKAKTLNLYNTHYSDSAGLADSGDYTTPFDLARLASFAMENPSFAKIVATKEKTIYDDSFSTSYNLENLNKLLGQDGVNGVKTGYTEEAGQVLVTSKDEKGHTIILVVMGSEDRFSDTQKLLDLVSNNITYLSIHP